MSKSLTVVVPTLNEASRLPVLLEALARQTCTPDAIVIADAGSTDDTIAVAESAGCRVVKGGLPARGRNSGAAAADTDLILFLDADVVPEDDFIEKLLDAFSAEGLCVATTLLEPLERDARNVLACETVNLYLQVVQYVAPHAPGFCILIERSVHDAIGGFDETVVLAEDHEYVQRAADRCRFGVITSTQLPVSMRRIDKEGLVRLSFKYLYCEMYALTGTPIRSVPFSYEFAAFEGNAEKTPALVDIGRLGESLGKLSDAIDEMTEPGRESLKRLGSFELTPGNFERVLRDLPSSDVAELQAYLGRRLSAAREARVSATKAITGLPGALRIRIADELELLRGRVPRG